MKISETEDYLRRNPTRVPADTVIANAEPLKRGLVLQLYGQWQFVVERELTREQFMAQLAKNRKDPDMAVGMARLKGSRLDPTAVDAVEPPPSHKYFYALRRLPGRIIFLRR